ncbi:hypothetical protein BAUCODRAFT_39759 [Baudoinia panamericana UAMH 10762]|uniref:Uncharacterized protein n=1 Tax=Baudoinia panamericana (strain UAMH 10762) TaxID=717646 RepID=M2M347_BAUPA|nr:uncharacterized protein BAUCODRAFT_39759 [Baudoinia panamericana UAMH 10762]EMC90961.1 hypothetical protein BAUCODRAFT_39759 [Baudoinia panamericana UAMH 10762]
MSPTTLQTVDKASLKLEASGSTNGLSTYGRFYPFLLWWQPQSTQRYHRALRRKRAPQSRSLQSCMTRNILPHRLEALTHY